MLYHVRSLSNVALSEPARSLGLYNNKSTTQSTNKIGIQKKNTNTEVCTLLPPRHCNLGPPAGTGVDLPLRSHRPSRELLSSIPSPRLSMTSLKTTMAPRAPFIPIRARRPPAPVSPVKRLLHAGDDLLRRSASIPFPIICIGCEEDVGPGGARRSWIVSL
jgi:hypothetical protein